MEGQDLKLQWPHDVALETSVDVGLCDRLNFYREFFRAAVEYILVNVNHTDRDGVDVQSEFINGRSNGNLHKKFQFAELMQSLGYRVPRQMLYAQGGNPDDLSSFFDQFGSVLCKPVNGSRGRGIFVVHQSDELVTALNAQDSPYIVQEYLPPKKDFRYIVQRDGDQLLRVCYEKHRPVVCGDGTTTLWRLILNEESIPLRSKLRIVRNNRRKLFDVPQEGETVQLVNSGNISQGAYGVLVDGEILNKIDDKILKVIQDLENQKGIRLSTYCFDIGLLKDDEVVFYEFQMPFGVSGYLFAPELSGNRLKTAKLMFRTFQKEWINSFT